MTAFFESSGTTVVQLFLKAPRLGIVKTRLAKDLGTAAALECYKQLVAGQMARLPEPVQVEVYFTPAEAAAEMRAWLGDDLDLFTQTEGGLGDRLEDAVSTAFQRGASNVICIGGDCPALGSDQIEQAVNRLDRGADVVFGPTEDGGYYLIALKAPQPALFRRIPWSAANTLEASLTRAETLKLKVAQLETLYDIDEAKDRERAIREGLLKA